MFYINNYYNFVNLVKNAVWRDSFEAQLPETFLSVMIIRVKDDLDRRVVMNAIAPKSPPCRQN
ncbi:hypothetical protein [Oscillatoria sp. HE19RPO]|uniref:hypothetical protein n=1 Tax=Oscillatoria sp. HE19RPO TaxID=2954806 RepID=UPI0020C3E9E2|nr:hypothetical protein [Oscillatoria sp. HE19RPO]